MFSRRVGALSVAFSILVAATLAVIGDEPTTSKNNPPIASAAARVKVSSFAAASDLSAQVAVYLASLSEPLADRAEWDETKQARVEKQAHMLATLAVALGMHDEPHPLKPTASALLNAAQTLASAGADYDGAIKALADAKLAAQEGSADGPARGENNLEWHQVAECGPLMKQAHIVEGAIKRGLSDPRRFKSKANEVAGHAVTLAAMAQSLAFDPAYISDEKDEEAWLDYCVKTRDAAAELVKAAKSSNAEGAGAAFQAMSKSCEACHDQFR